MKTIQKFILQICLFVIISQNNVFFNFSAIILVHGDGAVTISFSNFKTRSLFYLYFKSNEILIKEKKRVKII